jgi:hypothetical protein
MHGAPASRARIRRDRRHPKNIIQQITNPDMSSPRTNSTNDGRQPSELCGVFSLHEMFYEILRFMSHESIDGRQA